MMGIETIQQFQREAAKRASRVSKQPYVAWPDETFEHIVKGGGIPNFGTYRPKGWKLVETHFVDKTGFGAPNEPALTQEKFFASLVPGHGYAMIEEGQFQCWVGEFVKVEVRPRRKRVSEVTQGV